MGISKLKLISICLITGLSAVQAEDNRVLERLEKGEVISSKTGSSFFVQAIVNKEPEKIQAIFSDLKKLPSVFPQIAFAVPYVGKGKEEGRNFLYLKLRGLGDGLGILTEVKSGGGEGFLNAKEIILSGEYNRLRDTAVEVDTSKEGNQIALKSQIEEANAKGERSRFVGVGASLILEGPLNDVMELPNVRMTISLGVSSYTQLPGLDEAKDSNDAKKSTTTRAAPLRKSYLIAKVSFGNQSSRQELGDYRGFGDKRLTLAERLGANVFSALRVNLEK